MCPCSMISLQRFLFFLSPPPLSLSLSLDRHHLHLLLLLLLGSDAPHIAHKFRTHRHKKVAAVSVYYIGIIVTWEGVAVFPPWLRY